MAGPLTETLVLATNNPFKAKELRVLLTDLPLQVLDLSDFPSAPTASEDGSTLAENALIKAQAIYAHCGLPALADDTGLEVEALGGRPGVISARYAGPEPDAQANRSKLLKELEGKTQRQARFVTVLALVTASGAHLFAGRCEGHIARRELASTGFGYESIFVPTGHTRCFAELTTPEKNAISHRGAAARQLIRQFPTLHDCLDTTRP